MRRPSASSAQCAPVGEPAAPLPATERLLADKPEHKPVVESLSQHLPPEHLDLIPRIHVLDGVSYGERLTLRHLLTHQAGLFDYAACGQFFGTIAASVKKCGSKPSSFRYSTRYDCEMSSVKRVS